MFVVSWDLFRMSSPDAVDAARPFSAARREELPTAKLK